MASIYLRRGAIYIHSNSRTIDGVWIATPPYGRINSLDDPGRVGADLRNALDESRLDVRHPAQDEWSRAFMPLLELAGVRSYATFVRNAKYFCVAESGQVLDITPSRNLGVSGGFDELAEGAITLRSPSADDLGKAILEALSKSM